MVKHYDHNFGALTCESCRTFFRRNATRAEESFTSGKDDKSHRHRRKRVKNTELIVSSTTELLPISDIETNFVVQIPNMIRGILFDLNELEMSRFKQLFMSMNVVKDPVVRCTSEMTTYTEEARIEDKYKRIVKMATNITEFNDLCAEDKVSLLKTGVPDIMCLTTVLGFDFEGEFWRVPIHNYGVRVPLEVLKVGKSGLLYTAHRKFMINLKYEYDTDSNLVDILGRLQQQTYMYLLQRYLEIKHNSKSESEIRFVRLMNCLQDLYAVKPLHVNNYIEIETPVKSPRPLMKELHNL
ncbi:unnamed protein product [Medioppia subpectinata]|uniref:Nuclear receptor domain-containing protein n=1 Tax=Medioppia subpectinata TaxID=1979941 RepID=A0A7R9KDP6_9ACAR|nr:unnamed protein product [Medioppia subpectinata]CAG2101223.1 unnamed protein product [Medioppia subpectinata]